MAVTYQVLFNTYLGSTYTYLWEFGDGATSTDETPTHAYTQSGFFETRVTVTNSLGAWEFLYSVLIPKLGRSLSGGSHKIPMAQFAPDVSFGFDPLAVVFTNNSTGLQSINRWEWHIDGVLDDTTKDFSHTFTDEGIYVVKLTAYSNAYAPSSRSFTIFVGDILLSPPVVTVMSADEETAIIGYLSPTFSATIAGGSVDTYLWDFGDGYTSAEASPTHEFTQPGIYTVTLTTTNVNGSTSASMNIRVLHAASLEKSAGATFIGATKIGYYTINTEDNRIIMYDTQEIAEYITSFGGSGSGDGQFAGPTDFTIVGGADMLTRIEV